MWAEYAPLKLADVSAHFAGTTGAGVVPIQDDDSCEWAAIDIDNHGSDEDLPIGEVDKEIRNLKLPLIACRSKSGGIHVYLFLSKPQPASRIRNLMNSWSARLGYAGAEVFPKQNKLFVGKDQQKALGNWINLPYMGGDATSRYAIRDGQKLTLLEFLALAEKLRQSEHDLRVLAATEYPDAPPCIQKLYANGVAQGHRNEALYNIVVFHHKANPDSFESKAAEANQSVFSKPLARAELGRTVSSASRPECGYRCQEEPIRSLCERDICLTRKFGITPADADRLNTTDALPLFADMVKYATEPVRWEFKIDGVKIGNVSTRTLLDWREMREVIADRLTKVVPLIKSSEWERILAPLMQQARVQETPDDASIAGVVRAKMREFASKCDLNSRGEDKNDRSALLRGLPVVMQIQSVRAVAFRGEDFIAYLRRTKSETLKGVDLWWAIQNGGAFHGKARVPTKDGDKILNVWCVAVKDLLNPSFETADFKSDL